MPRRFLLSALGLFTVLAAVAALQALSLTPVLLPSVLYGSGGSAPNALAIADLNLDGVADAVVAHFAASDTSANGTLGILLGNGDATFGPVAAIPSGATASDSIAVADMNSDGIPDLVVGNSGSLPGLTSSAVTVLLGRGDGSFQPPMAFNSGGSFPSIAIADVNDDGKLDVLTANLGGDLVDRSLDVLLGNGDGSLRQPVPYDAGGVIATGVAVADVNGDGKPDLVTTNFIKFVDRDNGAVGVLLGNGNGTFQPPVAFSSGGFGATSLAISDVNHDGNLDVVVANCSPSGTQECTSFGSGAGVVGVLLGNGDGTFRDAVSYDMGGLGAGKVAIADINGDGPPDILVASCAGMLCTNAVAILLGNGDGSFQAPVPFDSGGLGAASVAAADLNRDGLPDVLTTTCPTAPCVNAALAVLVNATPPPDTTPPVVGISVSPNELWPSNGRLVPVTVFGTITDAGAGLDLPSATFVVSDEYGRVEPHGRVVLSPSGDYSVDVTLQASRVGSDQNGRLYRVTVVAKDLAGNIGRAGVDVIVPHSQGR
jgi:FG-GAP-like repeat